MKKLILISIVAFTACNKEPIIICKECETGVTYTDTSGASYEEYDPKFEDCTNPSNQEADVDSGTFVFYYTLQDSTITITGEKKTVTNCRKI